MLELRIRQKNPKSDEIWLAAVELEVELVQGNKSTGSSTVEAPGIAHRLLLAIAFVLLPASGRIAVGEGH